jgi:RNA polymerase sigma factor (sigma-70 family)
VEHRVGGNQVLAGGHEPGDVPLDDSTLWERSRTGDADAFTMLFERHAKAIYNFCFRRTGDWSAAEDLLSIVFLEAWRRRAKRLPPDKVLPWLYGIATNVVRNRRRAERRYRAALARMPAAEAEAGFDDEAVARIDDEQRVRAALAALGALPRRQQDVVVLCAWADLSYEDAAFALGLPVGTVRSRLSRARRTLEELARASGHEHRERPNVQEGLEG